MYYISCLSAELNGHLVPTTAWIVLQGGPEKMKWPAMRRFHLHLCWFTLRVSG